jgi:hypothetical protein
VDHPPHPSKELAKGLQQLWSFYHSDGRLQPTIEALDAAFSIGFPFHD